MIKSIDDMLPGVVVKQKILDTGRLELRKYISNWIKPGEMIYSLHYINGSEAHNFCGSSLGNLGKEDYLHLMKSIEDLKTFQYKSDEYNSEDVNNYLQLKDRQKVIN